MARRNTSDGSETSGQEAVAEPSQQGVAAETTDTAQADTVEAAPETVQTEDGAAEAGDTAEQDENSEPAPEPTAAEPSQEAPTADASRTVFVTGARAGDQCICPDGRTGTVHSFDSGLVCIPNHDQG